MVRRLAYLVIALALGSCGEEAPEPAPTIEPDEQAVTEPVETAPEESSTPTAEAEEPQSMEPQPTEATPPDAPQPSLPTPEPGRAHVFVVPEGVELRVEELADLAIEGVETRSRTVGPDRSVSYPEIPHPDARTRRLLNERIAALAVAADARQAPPGRGWQGDTTCEVQLATEHLVSIVCTTSVADERGMWETGVGAFHLKVEDGVQDLQLAELFVPETDFAAIVREACSEEGGDYHACDRWQYAIAIDAYGLVIQGVYGETVFDPLAIPYEELADRLLASGPLARSLDRRDVTTRAIDVAAAAHATAGPLVERWAVMPMAAFSDLAAAWASLPPEQRQTVQRAGSYLVATDAASARAAASTLGTEASEVRAPATNDGLVLVRAARDASLLDQPERDATVLRVLPRGTIFVTAESPSGEGARYIQAVAHAELSGFVDRRQLDEASVCAPDLAPFLATLPQAAQSNARTRTLRSALAEGSWGRATYITEIDGVSHVELRRIEDACTVDRSLLRYTRPGTVETLSVTRTARRGGESLIVTVTTEPSVSIHTFGRSEPAWTRALASGDRVETSVRDGDAWYPIVVQRSSGNPVRVTWGESGAVVAE